MSNPDIGADTQVSHTDDRGRTLSGMGVQSDVLQEVMERHAPEEAAEPASAVSEPEAEPAQPPKGRRRYSELTSERDAAKAEAVAAKAEREALQRERDELKAKLEAPAPTAKTEPAKPAAEPAAKPQKFQTFDEFAKTHPDADWDDYYDARTLFNISQANGGADINARIEQALAAEREKQAFHQTFERSIAKGRESYADFDAVSKSGPGVGVNLGPTPESARARVAYIVNHPQTEHLQYAIMKDGDLAKRLGSVSDLEFGDEIAKLVPQAQPVRRAAQTPAPPAPYQPVNGGTPTASTPSSALADKGYNFDQSGYREKRAAERKAARGR